MLNSELLTYIVEFNSSLFPLYTFHNLQEYIQPIAFASKECGVGLGADADMAAQYILADTSLATLAIKFAHGRDDDLAVVAFSAFFP